MAQADRPLDQPADARHMDLDAFFVFGIDFVQRLAWSAVAVPDGPQRMLNAPFNYRYCKLHWQLGMPH